MARHVVLAGRGLQRNGPWERRKKTREEGPPMSLLGCTRRGLFRFSWLRRRWGAAFATTSTGGGPSRQRRRRLGGHPVTGAAGARGAGGSTGPWAPSAAFSAQIIACPVDYVPATLFF